MKVATLYRTRTDNTFVQLFRYTIVGGTAFCFDFATLHMLTAYAGFHYLVSAAFAFILGLLVNYVLSVRWVFANRSLKNRYAEFIVFALVGLAGLGLNELIMWGATEYGGVHYLGSKLISTVVVYLFNFSIRKVLLF